MEQMSCFEFQSQVSDFLDGALADKSKARADDHLEDCKDCSERYKRFRIILSSITNQPRSTLPVPIRKAPLASGLPRVDSHGKRSRWQQTPWYIRTSVEGLGIAFTILFVVAMIPKIRALYERSMERRLEIYGSGDLALGIDGKNGAAPLARGKVSEAGDSAKDDEFTGEYGDDNAIEDSVVEISSETKLGAGAKIRVGNSEVWRFSLKTDSPREVRPRVVKTLQDLGLPATTPGIGGIEAPGGIQFNLFVPQQTIAELKAQLEKLATASDSRSVATPSPASKDSERSASGAFTWYKNKSKKTLPSGQSRVVIWLSQM